MTVADYDGLLGDRVVKRVARLTDDTDRFANGVTRLTRSRLTEQKFQILDCSISLHSVISSGRIAPAVLAR
jgi:hypothetical protein